MRSDPGLYDYWPYVDRPRITWPNGARIAFWVAPNIEFYELDPPVNPAWKGTWARPVPDVQAYSHRDYGNRVGVWRMMEAMDRYGVRGSVSLNVALCDHHPEIIEACAARDWEFFSHGIYNTRYTYDMSRGAGARDDRGLQADRQEVQRAGPRRLAGPGADQHRAHDGPARRDAASSTPATSSTTTSRRPSSVRSGRLISMPYSLEMNDVIVYTYNFGTPRHYGDIIKAQFDQLYAEGARSGTVMCIPLHPYLVGQPHRLEAFDEALEYVTGHDEVWVTTGREIADWYYAHHYDTVAAAIAARAGA